MDNDIDKKQDSDTAKPADDAAKKLADLEKQNAELAAKAKAAEDAEAKRVSDAKKRADDEKKAKALEEGKGKELAVELDAKLKAAEAERERLSKILTDRADAAVKALPEAEQKRLAAYKGRVADDVWLQMIDDAHAAAGAAGGERPPAPPAPGGNPGANKPKGIAPKAATLEVLSAVGRPDAARQFESIQMVRATEGDENGAPTGARKFTKSVEAFFSAMNRVPARTLEEAKK